MVGNDVHMMVDRMYIGGGFISNLIALANGLRLTGGIKRYTLSRGYYLNNISNNFAGGKMGRYGYGNYLDATAREKLDGTDAVKLDGDQLAPASLEQDKVGDFYSTNYRPQNSELGFYSVDDFSLLGELIRNRNLINNADVDYAKIRYGEEGADNKFIARNVRSTDIGKEEIHTYLDTDYDALFGERNPLSKSGGKYRANLLNFSDSVSDGIGLLNRNIELYEKSRPLNGVYNGDDITPEIPRTGTETFKSGVEFGNTEFYHLINDIGYKVREKYKEYRIVNPVVNSKDRETILSGVTTQANYGDLYNVDDVVSLNGLVTNFLTEEGIFDYDINYSKRNELNKLRKYNHLSPYGFKLTSEDAIYEIPEKGLSKYFAASSHTLDTKYIGYLRATRKTSTHSQTSTHEYYNEVDMGRAVTDIITHNESDGFTANLMRPSTQTTRLIDKTNAMFVENKIKSLINRFHTDNQDDFANDELVTAYDSTFGLSRGRNLLRKQYDDANKSGFNNPYCRVWTAHHQYAKMKDRIRPFMNGDTVMSIKELQSNYGNLRPNGTILSDYTTLQDNGFVKITPYRDSQTRDGIDLKKYMFSIENLAWKGFANSKNLSKEQQGPNGGRIMWFPPYNLKFQENVNTQWKDNEFIGRGEKIYTYANTERGGTLSFTLLIDHPAIINKWAGNITQATSEQEQDLLRYFAGCGQLTVGDEELIAPTSPDFPPEDNKDNTTPLPRPDNQYYYKNFIVFFPNDFSAKSYWNNMKELFSKIDEYEMTKDGNANFKEMDEAYQHEILAKYNYDNFSLFALNTKNGLNENKQKVLDLLGLGDIELLSYEEFKDLEKLYSGKIDGKTSIFGYSTDEYEIDNISVGGFASDHGYASNNKKLCSDRATTIKKMAQYLCGSIDDNKIREGEFGREVKVQKVDGKELVNDIEAKIARSAVIKFAIKLKDDVKPVSDVSGLEGNVMSSQTNGDELINNGAAPSVSGETESGQTNMVTIHNDISPDDYYTYQNEYLYFNSIKETDNMVYQNIVNKIKHFEPAFHSITPEGFNARLNFLHQCTRQGPTIGSHAGGKTPEGQQTNMTKMAANLAFGMAPYCILRVGDFFYSKICIQSLSISYDTGNGVQWDLNPEGAGVQPMMANIDISFQFVGGQNLDGPVAQLQNAITSNYYANSSVYTPKFDLTHNDEI